MFEFKLSVLKQKLFSYVKETANVVSKRRDLKAVAKRQRPLYWKLGRSMYLYRAPDNVPPGRIFSAIYRCLNFSVAAIISPYPNVSKIWKTFTPSSLKGSQVRTIWVRAARSRKLPPFSREHNEGFQGKNPDESAPQKTESEDIRGGVGLDSGFLCIKRDSQVFTSELAEPPKVDMTRRRRLACPTPPEELHGLPPSRLGIPSQTLDSSPTQKEESGDQQSKEQARNRHNNPLPSSSKNRPSKKDYFNMKNFKSSEYVPQVEISPKMNALLFDPVTLSFHYDRVNAPTKIFKDEVLIEVAYSGVSATDHFVADGKVFCGLDPVILGHEISGRVYALGTDVDHVKRGDHVVVNAQCACGSCRYCSRGIFSSCLKEGASSIGALRNGGWAQYVIVKKSQVHKIPEGLGLDQAALVQPLSCVLCAFTKLNILYGADVFIQGLGLSGCLWASLLHSRGHKNVIVTDKNERKRALLESLDLDYEFIPPEEVGNQSADVVIECAGCPDHIEQSFNIINPNGKLCFFGKPNPKLEVRCVPYDMVSKGITVVGNLGNTFCFTEALEVAPWLASRYLDFDRLGIRVFDLRNYREAFRVKKSGEATKIVFTPDS